MSIASKDRDNLHRLASRGGSVVGGAPAPTSRRRRLVALLLCLFLGLLGAHRFYVGKWLSGIIWILSLGIIGCGVLLDLLFILTGFFDDADGNVLRNW